MFSPSPISAALRGPCLTGLEVRLHGSRQPAGRPRRALTNGGVSNAEVLCYFTACQGAAGLLGRGPPKQQGGPPPADHPSPDSPGEQDDELLVRAGARAGFTDGGPEGLPELIRLGDVLAAFTQGRRQADRDLDAATPPAPGERREDVEADPIDRTAGPIEGVVADHP